MPGVEQARRLLEHAREITSEIYKFSLELTPDIHEAASRKLAYAKQVLESINKLTLNPDALTDTDLQDVIFQIIVSIRPNLIVAVDELEKALQNNQYFKLPASEPRSQADILKE
jgi:hypothetical protein